MSTAAVAKGMKTADAAELGLHRKIDWTGAFWVASGVPALVLFSIGGIAGTSGKLAFLVWIPVEIWGQKEADDVAPQQPGQQMQSQVPEAAPQNGATAPAQPAAPAPAPAPAPAQ